MSGKSKHIPIKTLFFIDAIGAAISTLFLGFILVQFQEYIGIPEQTLLLLTGIALCFMSYSITCYSLKSLRKAILLKIIGLMNLTYSILTVTLVAYHFHELTILGFLYFLGEVGILWILASFELRAKSQK